MPAEPTRSYDRNLIEASLDPLVTISPDGTITDVNAATVQATGLPREELIGTDFSTYFTEPARAKAGYEAAFRSGEVRDYELELRHRDGTVTPVVYNATVYRDEAGAVAGVFAAARDVTGQRKAEVALQQASAYNRSLIEASLDPLVTINPDGTVSDVNEATVRATGLPRDALIGTHFSSYFTDPERARAGYETVFREGTVTDYALELRHRDGRIMPVLYNAAVFRDQSGAIAGIFAAARDMTERKKAEEERSRLAAIVDSTDDAIIGKTLDGTITSWNPGAERVYGYTAAEIVGRHISLLAPPGQEHEAAGMLEQARRGGSVHHFETVRIRRDGTPIHVSLTLSPIRDLHGGVVGASTIARDISDQKTAEEAVRQASAYNRSLIEASLDPLVTISPGGAITDVNAATVQATGLPREELIGTDFSTYFTEPARAKAGYEAAFRSGEVRDYELELRHRDGTVTPVVYNATVYRDEAGAVAGVFAAARDVTERKRAEEALLAAYNELDDRVRERTADLVEANRSLEREIAEHKATADVLEQRSRELVRSNDELQQFAYIASHDLQEPLRAIAGFTELIERRYRGQLDAKADRYIDFILNGTSQMQQVIQDLLAYSRVQTKAHEFERTDANLAVEQALRNLQASIRDRKAVVTVEGRLPEIYADEIQITQVFQNLISNALKFQRPGTTPEIRISVRREGDEWRFSVADNGIGIDERHLDRIFMLFQRLHGKGEYEGTGIGLAICKRIVERHGGSIAVESTPGAGSTFTFSIPARNGV